jgi:hypothetical protein
LAALDEIRKRMVCTEDLGLAPSLACTLLDRGAHMEKIDAFEEGAFAVNTFEVDAFVADALEVDAFDGDALEVNAFVADAFAADAADAFAADAADALKIDT